MHELIIILFEFNVIPHLDSSVNTLLDSPPAPEPQSHHAVSQDDSQHSPI